MFITKRLRSHRVHRPRAARVHRRSLLAAASGALVAASALSGCSLIDDGIEVVHIGYQSKTLNTVNAGTIMRDQGLFEKQLEALGARDGKRYRVVWHDFASGAPLTAAMIATQVDIGSMGDYPLVTNGSKSAEYSDAATEFVGTTGYNLQGSLNQVVVPVNSEVTTLGGLRGKQVSTSLGSAGDGMLATALSNAGVDANDVKIANQDPSIGSAALEGGQVDAMAQFVPWPQLMVYRGKGRLLYDGGQNGVPTFHGLVARKKFTAENPEVMVAFLTAMKKTNEYIAANPMQAVLRLSEITGIEPEVAYLYNGPNGMVSFDPTIKPQFADTFRQVKEFLVKRGSVSADFDTAAFENDSYLQKVYGAKLPAMTASTANPTALTGYDDVCRRPVDDPGQASEVWMAGADDTEKAATPTCLLRRIAGSGKQIRAAYVPDPQNGLKLFADHAFWVSDPQAPALERLLPFATAESAQNYLKQHPGAAQLDYSAALREATPKQ